MQTHLTRRSFLALSGTVSMVGVLAACAAPGAAPAADAGAASAEPTLIEFLGSPGMDVHLEEEYTRFKEENPGLEWIQVQQQQGIQLLTAIASGTAPDTARVESNVYRTFVRDGVLMDITDYIDADAQFSQPDYWLQPQESDRCTQNGRWFGIGSCWVAPHIYYNADIFEAEGIEPPSNDPEQAWEWDHFLTVARQLTVDTNGNHPGDPGFDIESVDRWGVNWPTWWIPLHAAVQSNGGAWVDAESQQIVLDTPEATQALQNIADLQLVHQVMPQAPFLEALGMSTVQMLETQKLAMQIDGSWALAWTWEMDATLGTAALPKMKRPATDLQAHLVTVVSDTEIPDESWELIRFLSSPWYQERYCNLGLWLPSQTALMTDEAINRWLTPPIHPDGYADIVTKFVPDYGHFLTMPVGYQKAADTVLGPAFDTIWVGDQSAEDAMQVVPEANEVLAAEAARGS